MATKLAAEEKPELSLSQQLSKYFKPRTLFNTLLDTDIRYWYSAAAVAFCFAILFVIVGKEESKIGIHGVPAVLIWWFMLFYLSCLEGTQAALVALQHIDPEVYRTSHPHAYKCATLGFKGNNLDKYIIGRQFSVVFVVFMIGYCTSYDADKMENNPFDLSDGFRDSMIKLGFVSALTTIVVGQLISQIVASRCNIDYLNYRFQYYAVISVCLFMEFIGLMHFVYLIQKVVVQIKGTDEAKKKQMKNQGNPFFFWGRVVLSTGVLALCLAIVFDSLFRGDTGYAATFPDMPNYSGLIFFMLLCGLVHCTEGLQVALFAMQKMDPEEIKAHAGAQANAAVAFKGNNLQAFLIGRQALTALSMFILSLITSVQADLTKTSTSTLINGTEISSGTLNTVEEGYTILGLGNTFSSMFLENGLVGAVVLTICASLSGQVIASAFPLGFCGLPGMWIVLDACLLVEFIGLTHFSWPLADGVQKLMGKYMQDDEVYLHGSKEFARKERIFPDVRETEIMTTQVTVQA
mmetsp:Transcript_28883/g.47899  ORF Transcript_28883/g.47899 Transcript_28883/m.47899 type:complete len:520 (-) Transcript_28883:472-2031(-)